MIFNQIPLPSGSTEAAEAAEKASDKLANDAAMLKSLSFEDLLSKLAHTMVDFAFHLAIAILVFYLGKFIIRRIYLVLSSIMIRRHVDKSLSTFILSLVRMVLYFILVVTVIGILGINTSSFIAIFASAGVAIGMALSGTLQNFAGGVLILLLKPYKVGDYIEAQGFAGTVTEIQIFSTIICTYDNKSIIIPNGGLSTSSINNWSRERYRRIDWTLSMAYGDDFDTTRAAILDMLRSDSRIVKTTLASDIEQREETTSPDSDNTGDTTETATRHGFFYRMFHRSKKHIRKLDDGDIESSSPVAIAKLNADRAPSVFLSNMGESSVDLSVRAWVLSTDYWTVYFDFNERFYRELPAHGVHFPFPQLDVHLNPSSGS